MTHRAAVVLALAALALIGLALVACGGGGDPSPAVCSQPLAVTFDGAPIALPFGRGHRDEDGDWTLALSATPATCTQDPEVAPSGQREVTITASRGFRGAIEYAIDYDLIGFSIDPGGSARCKSGTTCNTIYARAVEVPVNVGDTLALCVDASVTATGRDEVAHVLRLAGRVTAPYCGPARRSR